MPNSPSASLFLFLFEQIRRQQEVLNDLIITKWAILSALTERDGGFYDAFLAHKEVNEIGEMGQTLAANLQALDESIARMKATSQ